MYILHYFKKYKALNKVSKSQEAAYTYSYSYLFLALQGKLLYWVIIFGRQLKLFWQYGCWYFLVCVSKNLCLKNMKKNCQNFQGTCIKYRTELYKNFVNFQLFEDQICHIWKRKDSKYFFSETFHGYLSLYQIWSHLDHLNTSYSCFCFWSVNSWSLFY